MAATTTTVTTTSPTATTAIEKAASQPTVANTTLEWREAVAGMFAATLSRTVMAPVERVKLIIQLQQQQQQQQQRLTAIQAARNVYVKEGFWAFWRGNLPSVLRMAGTSAISFTCLDYYKRALIKPWLHTFQHAAPPPMWWSSLVAGGLAGATSTTVLYPLEFVRTRLALDQSKEFRNIRHVVAAIVAKDGVTGLYQGYGVALVGSAYYRILYLGGYDAIKSELLHQSDSKQLTWIQRLVLAQSISLMAGTLAYPLDSIRRRMMMQAGQARAERAYRNGWHCFQTVLKTEGIRGFFLGLGPNIVRSVGGAMLLVAYDTMRDWLGPPR